MEDRKKKGRGKRAIALLLTLLLTLSPCLQGDLLAQAASFMLKMKGTSSMLMDVSFSFFGDRMGSGIYYWEKSDGSPLFCVQQHARAGLDLNGTEAPEAFGEDIHFTPSQYELVSLILQCCGMRRGETGSWRLGITWRPRPPYGGSCRPTGWVWSSWSRRWRTFIGMSAAGGGSQHKS